MPKNNDLALVLFIVIMGGAVAFAIANDIAAPLCESAKIKSAAPDKIEFGCFEFWFNRYQSLFGNVLTAAVAGLSLFWIARQLAASDAQARAASRQTAVSAAQALRQVVTEMVQAKSSLFKIQQMAYKCISVDKKFYAEIVTFDDACAVSDVAGQIRQIFTEINEIADNFRLLGDIEELEEIISSAKMAIYAIRESERDIRRNLPNNNLSDNRASHVNPAIAKVIAQSRSEIFDFMIDVHAKSVLALVPLDIRIKATWQRIRDFENHAIGG